MNEFRVFLLDGSPDFLSAVEHFLRRDDRIQCIGCARPEDSVQALADAAPDLVITDFLIPVEAGMALIQRLKALPGKPDVMVLTLHTYVEYELAARSAGADAFLAKWEVWTRLLPMVQSQLMTKGGL